IHEKSFPAVAYDGVKSGGSLRMSNEMGADRLRQLSGRDLQVRPKLDPVGQLVGQISKSLGRLFNGIAVRWADQLWVLLRQRVQRMNKEIGSLMPPVIVLKV